MAHIKATSSVCYDNTGLTFPVKQSFDLETFPVRFWWDSYYPNTPKQIYFLNQDIEQVKKWVEENQLDDSVIVVEWNKFED